MSKLIILTPTKGRPDNLQRLNDSFKATSTKNYSSLMPILDRVEAKEYPDIGYLKCPQNYNLVEKLNFGAKWAIKADFKYLAFLGDDVVIHTPGFDVLIDEAFAADPTLKIIHCADKLHNGTIANHWVIRADVIRAVGFFALPVCKHMFIDNFWTHVGRETNSIKYMDNVLWEHLHYMSNRSRMDNTYQIANNEDVFTHDQDAYNEFLSSSTYINFLTVYNNV